MQILEIFTILSFVTLVALLFFVGSIIFILKKGINEIITGMEALNKRLEALEKKNSD